MQGEFEQLLEFKQYLRGKYASEYLSAFTWLYSISEMAEEKRVAEMKLFWQRFISSQSEERIDFAEELGSEFSATLCSGAVIHSLLTELMEALKQHQANFKPSNSASPRRRRKLLSKVQRTPSDEYCYNYALRKNRRFSIF
jgi:hypothetical protein